MSSLSINLAGQFTYHEGEYVYLQPHANSNRESVLAVYSDPIHSALPQAYYTPNRADAKPRHSCFPPVVCRMAFRRTPARPSLRVSSSNIYTPSSHSRPSNDHIGLIKTTLAQSGQSPVLLANTLPAWGQPTAWNQPRHWRHRPSAILTIPCIVSGISRTLKATLSFSAP